MAIRAGHYGQLVLTKQSGAGGTPPDVVELFELRVRREREMVDITPPDVDSKQHWPSHRTTILFYRGWIDGNNHPGTFDTVLPYSAVLRPDSLLPGNKLTFNCWVRLLEWHILIGQPNMTSGELISDDDVDLFWT